MDCLPLLFIEDVCVFTKFYDLENLRLLSTKWSGIAQLHSQKRSTLGIQLNHTSKLYQIANAHTTDRVGHFGLDLIRKPLELDFKYVNNLAIACSGRWNVQNWPHWKTTSLRDIKKLISRFAGRTSDQNQEFIFESLKVFDLNKDFDIDGLGSVVFSAQLHRYEILLQNVRNYGDEIDEFLLKSGKLRRAFIADSDISERTLDIIINKFCSSYNGGSLRMEEIPFTVSQIERLFATMSSLETCGFFYCGFEHMNKVERVEDLMKYFDLTKYFTSVQPRNNGERYIECWKTGFKGPCVLMLDECATPNKWHIRCDFYEKWRAERAMECRILP